MTVVGPNERATRSRVLEHSFVRRLGLYGYNSINENRTHVEFSRFVRTRLEKPKSNRGIDNCCSRTQMNSSTRLTLSLTDGNVAAVEVFEFKNKNVYNHRMIAEVRTKTLVPLFAGTAGFTRSSSLTLGTTSRNGLFLDEL